MRTAFRVLQRFVLRRKFAEEEILRRYARVHKRGYDVSRPPERFTEHVIARMLEVNRSGNSLYSRLSDKYRVREYVRERVGEDVLTSLIWVGGDPRCIPFDFLPPRCILKVNNGSGGNIRIDGVVDREAVVRQLRDWLRMDYSCVDHEYHYAQIKPLVVVEELLDDGQEDGPLDYKLWCFDGVPHFIQVDNSRHSINAFYTPDWVQQPFRYRDNQKDFDMPRPSNLDRLLEIGARLAKGFDFVRVDLYNVQGNVKFGEMTFTPVGGHMRFRPDDWDLIIGQYWPKKD